MQIWQSGLVLLAGVGAGAVNAVAGSGTLITFPVLLALGQPPLVANVSNNLGLLPGGVAGAWGYRQELSGQRARVRALLPWSLLGAVGGAALLLTLPSAAFDAVVPVLIVVAVLLVLLQPMLTRRVAGSGARRSTLSGAAVGCGLCAVYGGYFGAAQGVLLVGVLGWLLADELQRVNALKNVLATGTNVVAAVVFLVLAAGSINWWVVALIAVGSTLGGRLGALWGRRLSPRLLRGLIAVIGLVAVVRLVAG